MTSSGDPVIQLAWTEAQTFDRLSPLLNTLATSMGLTDREVDELFLAAQAIRV